MKKRISFLALACIVLTVIGAWGSNAQLHPALEQKLKTLAPGEQVPVIVELKEQARLSDIAIGMRGAGRRERARAIVAALRSDWSFHRGNCAATPVLVRRPRPRGVERATWPECRFRGPAEPVGPRTHRCRGDPGRIQLESWAIRRLRRGPRPGRN